MDRPGIAVAVVGVSAILPDAPDAKTFWQNLVEGRYSITDVDPDRWDPAFYYDPDPAVPDKTYSKIGGWVRDWEWDPIGWRLPIPPRTADAMDEIQKWSVNLARATLADYGWPARPLNLERTGVIVGNALAGEKQWQTMERIAVPNFERDLEHAATFAALPQATRTAILAEARTAVAASHPVITEDTMPGELANVIAGRVANLFDMHGPNYVCDAACASALAAMNAAVGELMDGHCDAVVTGGIDRTMNATAFVKFCKIGALSATGTRPYGEGADGFVMGEGGAFFLLKRLADAERDGDLIYAVVRGLGGSSDGKGKGITAPNPAGQRLAVERAWQTAGLSPASATLIEGHGTSTRVGDAVEFEALSTVLREAGAGTGSIGLGSVKSNFGHLKAAAGAAGLLKTVLALHHGVIPPTLHCERPNPDLDFAHSSLRVVTKLEEWARPKGGVRRAGVSAFGFGGTNFHAILDEYLPGALDGKRSVAVTAEFAKAPLRGAAVLGATTPRDLASRLEALEGEARAGTVPPRQAPAAADLGARERVAIDFGSAAELAEKAALARRALAAEPSPQAAAAWKALRARGIFRGAGAPAKVAFLYTGQGSQYANMLCTLRATEPIVRDTFAEADRIMQPLLGRALSDVIFVAPAEMATAEAALRETEITQPAVMTVDLALTRLLEAYGVKADMVMGHSLGEYGALMAAGSLTFAHTLEAVSARGREMSQLSVADRGVMAAVMAPLAEIAGAVAAAGEGVVIANVNSSTQAVIGGPSEPVRLAMAALSAAGHQVVELPVSHAFHTAIVAPVSEPLKQALVRLELMPPRLPIVSNVTGAFYPSGHGAVPQMLELLGRQVAEPVQFVAGLRTLYEAGARVFVEVGPKRALQVFADDVLGGHDDVVTLFTNHPKTGEIESFNQALCGLYAAGLGATTAEQAASEPESAAETRVREPVVITGAALGLPGTDRVFDDLNLARILAGEQFIDVIPTRLRNAMLDKHITRLVKREGGDPTFETIDDPDGVIRLAGRAGKLDLTSDFGVPEDLVEALDRTTQLAMGAGLDALRDAGIPLAMHYRPTTSGTHLPERWALGDAMRDDTGVIFASAMPGLDQMAKTITAYERAKARDSRLASLERIRERVPEHDGGAAAELDREIGDLRRAIAREPYVFDRRFLFRVLSMGHSQFAQYIGARGPNTQINAACASTTQAVGLAQDWIRAGRCRRVLVVAGDDPTSDSLMEWVGAGFLASGAAATDDVVENAAIPFDRRRHGMVIGMGAAAIVIESASAARERGLTPICEVLATASANSAFHGTRLDPRHISQVMESLVAEAERESGIARAEIAPMTVFVSHETYTPARGGSAAAEVDSLRAVFGERASQIVVANTKGFTGHAMGVGIEDVVAVKSLETGIVPPVPNFKEQDPELGSLNLSRGGSYAPEYALRLAAGFGSQISLALLRRVPPPGGQRRSPDELGYGYRIFDRTRWQAWLQRIAGRPDPELEVVSRTLRISDVPRVVATPPREEEQPLPVPAPQPPQAVAAPAVRDPIADKVLALVAEKTGYPVDMLGLDLDLEADLGIDTVKQAELFSTLRQTYGFERDEKLQLREFPTLAHVIGFVHRHVDGVSAPAPNPENGSPAPAAPPAAVVPVVRDPIADKVLALVAAKTGYPVDMLGLDLDLEADLGIDTVKQAELFTTLRQTYGFERDEKLQLREFPTLAHVIGFVHRHVAGASAPEPKPSVAASAPAPNVEDGAAASPPAAVVPAVRDAIADKVLELVAEKTGYPVDMLGLDLDLEADLGIDTVKQAELFSTLRQTYDFERDEKLQLREFPTLAHVIGFVHRHVDGASATAPAPVDAVSTAMIGRTAPASAADAFPRRVPVPVLAPPADVCAPTLVALGEGTRVVVMAGEGGTGAQLRALLEARGATPLVIDGFPPAAELEKQIEAWTAAGAVTGMYWLPALDVEPALAELDLVAWKELLRRRVGLLHTAVRALDKAPAARESFLIAATPLGGRHGYGPRPAIAPMGGSVAGYVKALRRERPDALVKVVDFAPATDPGEIARQLVEETLVDPATVEIGRSGGERWTVGLEERPAGRSSLKLSSETVFLVTGAAGSIVSAIVADLAAACGGGVFHLLDLTPEPDPADPDVARFAADRDALKADLAGRMRAAGEKPTPAMVDKRLAGIERSHEALRAIEAVRTAGGQSFYHVADITDPVAVAAVVGEIGARHGRIDVLIHAAGIEISRLVADKEPEEFARVFGVKADGWFNVMKAAGPLRLGAVIAFSSVAGRFGNAGQTDYSAANDLLCKSISNLRVTRPDTHAVAIDWTAWAGIGMATRGSIPRLMEAAGIELLPPEAGVATVRREILGDASGEVVVAGRLGALLSTTPTPVAGEGNAWRARAPLVHRITGMTEAGELCVQSTFDPREQPFLDHHRIDGTAVLPGVMGIELMAETAAVWLPGRLVGAIENVEFIAPFKFYRDQPRTLQLRVRFEEAGEDIVAHCRLIGARELTAREEPQVTTHFTADVRLVKALAPPPGRGVPPSPAGATLAAADIRKVYFHGPAFQVLEAVWKDGSRTVGRLVSEHPPLQSPAGARLLTEPRLVELCFQTAGVIELGTSGRLALPARVRRIALHAAGDVSGGLVAVTEPAAAGGFEAFVAGADGRVVVEVSGYETVEVPLEVDGALLEPFRSLTAVAP